MHNIHSVTLSDQKSNIFRSYEYSLMYITLIICNILLLWL